MWKENDVFKWWYNEAKLKQLNHGNNGGTTYWCVSNIAIAEADGFLYDTFWNSGTNKCFDIEFADKHLELVYLGNLNDYRPAVKWEQACYADKDCLDISHSNCRSGLFYIRKDAVHDQDKKRRIIERNVKKITSSISYQLSQIKRYKELLETECYKDLQSLYVEDDVSMYDEHYLDKEEIK
jgi:hypothetical protein